MILLPAGALATPLVQMQWLQTVDCDATSTQLAKLACCLQCKCDRLSSILTELCRAVPVPSLCNGLPTIAAHPIRIRHPHP